MCADEMLLKAVGGAKSALTKLKYVSSSHKGDDDDGSEDRLKAALQEYTQVISNYFIITPCAAIAFVCLPVCCHHKKDPGIYIRRRSLSVIKMLEAARNCLLCAY